MELAIVPYQPEHRPRIREIVCDTAFAGKPVDPFFEDRELFADINTKYYTDMEPESIFVALADNEVAGYLLTCVDTERYVNEMTWKYAPELLLGLVTGRYHVGPRALTYFLRNGFLLLSGVYEMPPLDLYPAHLHINLAEGFRRFGLGRRLIQACFDYLGEKNSAGVHLGTSSIHAEAVPFYHSLGFETYSTRRMRVSPWADAVKQDIYSIIFVKRFEL